MVLSFSLCYAQEICGNGLDDDGNGLIDCYDPACYIPPGVFKIYNDDEYCEIDTPILLQALPAGGVFTGNGVSGNYFNPIHAGAGQHTLTYTVTQGSCTYVIDTTVTVYAFAIADAGNDTTVCLGQSVRLGMDSIPTATYLWIPFTDLNNMTAAQPIATHNSIGIYTYIMYIFRNGCYATDTINVTVSTNSYANAGNDWFACTLDTLVQFHPSPSGGVWHGEGIVDSLQGYYSPSQVGVGTFTLTYTTQQVCPATDTMLITVLGLADVGITADTSICIGQQVQIEATGGYIFNWQPALYLNDASIGNPIASPLSDITYAVTVLNDTSCPNTDSVHITVFSPPSAGFSIDTVCVGTANTITDLATPQDSIGYTWIMGDGNTISNTLTNYTYANGGIYPIIQIVQRGVCADTAYKTAIVDFQPIADFTIDNACEGVATFINDLSQAQGPVDYTWNMGDGNTVNDTMGSYLYNNAGNYEVMQVINLGACVDTAVKYVLISDAPLADFDYSLVDSQTVSFNNTSQGSASWQWLFGDSNGSNSQNPNHHYNHAGDYHVWLVAVSDAGCNDSTMQVIVMPNPSDTLPAVKDAIFIPNAFSPNGDGNNDIWQVFANASINYFNLNIYNRWGEKVYESNNQATGWDGRYKGELQSPQTYVYMLTLVLQSGERRTFKGGLLLMK